MIAHAIISQTLVPPSMSDTALFSPLLSCCPAREQSECLCMGNCGGAVGPAVQAVPVLRAAIWLLDLL